MQISSIRAGGVKYYIPDGLKQPEKEIKQMRPITSTNTSLQQKAGKLDAQIMCKRINEEPVKINRETDRKEFVPLALTIERKRKVILPETETGKKPVIEPKSIQPINQPGVINIRDQINQQQSQIKPLKKPEQQKKASKAQPKGQLLLPENRTSSLLPQRNSIKSPKNVLKKDNNTILTPNLLLSGDTDRSKIRQSFRQTVSNQKSVFLQTLPSITNTSLSKSKRTISSERNTLRKKEPEKKVVKAQVSTEFDQMIKENSRKLLEEKKRLKQDEQRQRDFEVKKKHRIIEEDQKVRQFNRYFFQTDRNKSGKYAWGIDQRKFNPQQSARERNESSPSEGNRKYHKIDEKERRERLGLGQLSSDKLNKVGRKSRVSATEDERQRRDEGSAGREGVIKKLISPEQERKLKELMGVQRQKMEEFNRAMKQDKQKEKLRIKENLTRLREEQKTLSQTKTERRISTDPSLTESGKKKPQTKNGPKSLYYFGIPTDKDKDSINYSISNLLEQDLIQQSLSLSEEDHNYSLLYNEYRKIINQKQMQQESSKVSEEVSYSQGSSRQNYYAMNKTKNTTGTKGLSDRTSAKSEASNMQHTNQEKAQHSLKEKHKVSPRDDKTNLQRREHVKKQFIDLAKRLEDVLGSNENTQVENLSNRQFVEEESYQIQSARYEDNQNIAMNIATQDNKLFNEFGDSNFVEENNFRDKSLESVEYREPREEDQEEVEENDSEPKSRREINSAENRLEFLPIEADSGDENYFNDDEAYQQNFRIIEAAAIFIQKNFRGYLTRKILQEYIEEMTAMQQHVALQQTNLANNNQGDNLQGYQAEEENYSPVVFHQRLTKSLDDRFLVSQKDIDDDDECGVEDGENNYMQELVAKNDKTRFSGDAFDEKYFDIYEKMSEQYHNQLPQPNSNIHRHDDEQDRNNYNFMNEKLQREMLVQNAGQYERKNKFLQDEPRIGCNDQEDISINYDDEEQEEPINADHNRANYEEKRLRAFGEQIMEEEDLEQNNEYREQMSKEDRPSRQKAVKARTPKQHEDEERPKRRFRRNKSENQSESPLNESFGASSEENALFSGQNTENQEKMVIVSTINSDKELAGDDGDIPAGSDHKDYYRDYNSLDKKIARDDSVEWEEHQQPGQSSREIYELKLPPSSQLEMLQSRPKSELLIREIDDNSKSLITVGNYDEALTGINNSFFILVE